MAKKKNVQNPYRGYSLEEVFEAEASSSIVEVGGDLYCEEGSFSLSNNHAKQMYEKLLVSLLKMINDGTDKERKEGLRLLPTLFLKPLRIH